jgi:hypothetical protein
VRTEATKAKTKWCAYGLPGYDTVTGKPYTVKDACQNPARPGHICCDPCRIKAGGVPR